MDKVASFSQNQRSQLFRETAARRSISPAIIEKDFWVCWVLKMMFLASDLRDHIVFKGGTSLSKVFGLIERFSEDIDLVLDWRLLGYGPGNLDPYEDQPSNTQQDRFNRQFNEKTVKYIVDTLCPQLTELLGSCPSVKVSIDSNDGQLIHIAYPATFPEEYLRPEIHLEIGPLASFAPSESHTIKPFAAQEFPNVFDSPDCPVVTITAERTFWEKATILHQQTYRTNAIPARYARHYYDIYQLAKSPVRISALSDLKLLADVVAFKSRFYRCSWAQYDKAKPGSLRLVPDDARMKELRADYRKMEIMIFGEVPSFDEIIRALHKLEDEINNMYIE